METFAHWRGQVDHNYISEGAKQSGNCLKDMGAASPLSHITSVGGAFPLLLTCKVLCGASLKEVTMPLSCVGDLVWTCKVPCGASLKEVMMPLSCVGDLVWTCKVLCGASLKEVMMPLSCVGDLVWTCKVPCGASLKEVMMPHVLCFILGVSWCWTFPPHLFVTVNSRIQTETFTDGHLGQMKLKMEGVILVEPHTTTFLCPKPQDFARVKFHEDSTKVVWLRL